MVLPIVVYGDPVLRKKCVDIDKDYPNLEQFIKDMYETMYEANGVGLAAPQVNKAIRLFVVDASPFSEDEGQEHLENFKKVFINAKIIEESGEEWAFNEGCLSIPGVRGDVVRKPNIKIQYWDENFKEHTDDYDGVAARIIQHEYDHIEGILFVEKLNPLKKKLLKSRLNDISNGQCKADYKMKFPNKIK